jgi:ribosomal protein S18 acetylase RimI-like enzyme
MVEARTTYLEMLRNAVSQRPIAPAGCELRLWRKPPLDQYRELFNAVGGDWGWSGRLLLSDDHLRAVLEDERIEIWRLYQGATVAGFIELDWRVPGEVEIVYFGLLPEFVGRGLGRFVLRSAVHHAWAGIPGASPTSRLWLHTCDFDSPIALGFYQKAGFRIYDERLQLEAYPAGHIARLDRRR